jgi:hypothetical protein
LHGLVVNLLPSLADSNRYMPVTIAALAILIYSLETNLEIGVPLASIEHLQLVIERAARQTRGPKQRTHRAMLPEFPHYLRFFFGAPRFFA